MRNYPDIILKSGALIIHPFSDAILLVRKTGTMRYILPGGVMRRDEEPKPALVRELEEELGWTPDDIWDYGTSLLLFHRFESSAEFEDNAIVCFVYVCKPMVSPSLIKATPQNEIVEARWFSYPFQEDRRLIGSIAKMASDSWFKRI